MGFYVNVTAAPGRVDQINSAFRQQFGDDLVATRDWIRSEIEVIHSDPDQSHMRWIKTVEDWNRAIPIYREGTGQIFIGSIFFPSSAEDEAAIPRLRAQVAWVLNRAQWFERISCLRDAEEALRMVVPANELSFGVPVEEAEVPEFANLPKGTGPIFSLCRQHDRPDLWSAWLAFEQNPCWETWDALRHRVIPGCRMQTVWQGCEEQHKSRTSENHGLEGFYRDGRHPSPFEVARVLKKAAPLAA